MVRYKKSPAPGGQAARRPKDNRAEAKVTNEEERVEAAPTKFHEMQAPRKAEKGCLKK
jgi:hypothetical protein